MRHLEKTLFIVILFAVGAFARAAVVLDGSLGPKGALAGPNFSLDAGKGKRVGSNLFYSFAEFSLRKGDVASFSSHVPVKNVLARVTGGGESNIDGTLRVSIPDASFYLINPNGVIFGPDAKLDVKGSFAVTTANEVKLADGGHFDVHLPDSSLLSTAAPAAFGFLEKSAPIAVRGASLSISTGNLTIAGGTVALTNATVSISSSDPNPPTIKISGDSISIADGSAISTRSPDPRVPAGNVTLSAPLINLTNTISITGTSGDINTGNFSINAKKLIMSGVDEEMGNTYVRAGSVEMTNSYIVDSDNYIVDPDHAGGTAASITIDANTLSMSGSEIIGYSFVDNRRVANGGIKLNTALLELTNNSQLDFYSNGSASGGDINIKSASMHLEDSNIEASSYADQDVSAPNLTIATDKLVLTTDLYGSYILAGNSSSGAALDVLRINAHSIRVTEGLIGAEEFSQGASAEIDITADSLKIHDDSLGGISSKTEDAFPGGNINIRVRDLTLGGLTGGISADTESSGQGGVIRVRADTIILDGGFIHSDTIDSTGSGGKVTVTARSILMEGGLISADSESDGQAGSVAVKANTLWLNGGQISTNTYDGTGAGGEVKLSAKNLIVDNGTISSDTITDGPGGDVTVNSNSIQLSAGAVISSDASGNGAGGNVNVTAGLLKIKGQGLSTGISADADGAGRAGDVTVNAHTIQLLSNGMISTNAGGAGDAGDVTVDVNLLTIDGRGSGSFTGISSESEAVRSAGRAGSVAVKANVLKMFSGGEIAADTEGSGIGGNVNVTARTLTLNGQNTSEPTSITTDSDASGAGGSAGNIMINADALNILGGAQITSSTHGRGNAGGISLVATKLTAAGGSGQQETSVSVQSFSKLPGAGSAGNLLVHANELTLQQGALLSTSTNGAGAAGRIRVFATEFAAEGSDHFSPSGIFSQSNSSSSRSAGPAGDIEIHAADVALRTGALLSALTKGGGRGGDVSIYADSLRLQDNSGVSATSDGDGPAGDLKFHVAEMDLVDASILTRAIKFSGGNVQIHAADQISLSDSQISTSALGAGGNIFIDPLVVSLNHSQIVANAVNKNGGNITIQSDAFVESADSVVSASSQKGVSGIISISAPNTDVAADIVQLTPSLASQITLQESCAYRFGQNFSSFVVEGAGGLPSEPGSSAMSLVVHTATTQPAAHP